MGFLWWLLMGVTAGPALACTAVSLDRRVKYLYPASEFAKS